MHVTVTVTYMLTFDTAIVTNVTVIVTYTLTFDTVMVTNMLQH